MVFPPIYTLSFALHSASLGLMIFVVALHFVTMVEGRAISRFGSYLFLGVFSFELSVG